MDCSAAFNVPFNVTADACAAAVAAIKAAQIQADAARYAGRLGLVIGILTILGGGAAVWATIKAARLQIEQAARTELAVARALHRHLRHLTGLVPIELNAAAEGVKKAVIENRSYDLSRSFVAINAFLEATGPRNWKELSAAGTLLFEIEKVYGGVNMVHSRIQVFVQTFGDLKGPRDFDDTVSPGMSVINTVVSIANSQMTYFVNLYEIRVQGERKRSRFQRVVDALTFSTPTQR